MRFVLALHTDDGSKYGVTVPDLPGCFSAADSFEEALDAAREAIDGHVELLAEQDTLPAVRPLAEHQANPDLEGAVWAVIDVPVEKYFGPAEKINITVPARVLRRIDNYAAQHGETRSGFLVRAAEQAIFVAAPVRSAEREGNTPTRVIGLKPSRGAAAVQNNARSENVAAMTVHRAAATRARKAK